MYIHILYVHTYIICMSTAESNALEPHTAAAHLRHGAEALHAEPEGRTDPRRRAALGHLPLRGSLKHDMRVIEVIYYCYIYVVLIVYVSIYDKIS